MKIAIIKLSALGDIIHSMIVLQFIKQKYPDAQITWIVDDSFKQILEYNLDIYQIIALKIKYAKQQKSLKLLWNEIKKVRKLPKFDVVIDMQGLLKSAIIAKNIPNKIVVGFDKNSIREKVASYFYTQKVNISYAENIVIRNCFLVAQALNFEISKKDIDNKKAFLFSQNYHFDILNADKKNIILILGASFASKIYPVAKYAKIAQQIDANFIATWGSDKELKLAQNLQKKYPQLKISPKLNFDELKNLLAKADLILGGDTGPVHMGWGLNVKTITLFGATPHQRNTWQNGNNLVISAQEVSADKIDKFNRNIDSIAEQMVVEKITRIM